MPVGRLTRTGYSAALKGCLKTEKLERLVLSRSKRFLRFLFCLVRTEVFVENFVHLLVDLEMIGAWHNHKSSANQIVRLAFQWSIEKFCHGRYPIKCFRRP